jgi:ATP-dependent helicase/nuclease subunit B
VAEGPNVYSIAAHRGFADALVAGLVPRYSEADFGLARLTLLLPSSRAQRNVSEAFIRHFGERGEAGLLMPRMAVVGDLDLDEALGALFDPLGAESDIPPAVDLDYRWLRLAELIKQVKGAEAPQGAALLRQADAIGKAMDRLLVEHVSPEDLFDEKVMGLLGDLADNWKRSLALFMQVQDMWLKELIASGTVDPADRRNRLFRAAARKWRTDPPPHPIVAAGVTSAAPRLAKLLRVVADLPNGAVILPDFDLTISDEVWSELGCAGAPEEPGGPVFERGDAVTHPQYHLKLLLNRMGVNRHEVQPWHRAGLGKGPPERSHAISSLFMPPKASRAWAALEPDKRRLTGVRIMETANPEEEAQAIALLLREALEEPGRRAALVTPDRGLAGRVVAHLARWNIAADDSAGRPLSQTAAGRVLLLLAEIVAEQAAPVPLMALLGHPLVGAGEGRPLWLERTRLLERALRGPKLVPGLAPVGEKIAVLARIDPGIAGWWTGIEAILAPLLDLAGRDEASLASQLDALVKAGEALCGEMLWARQDGRALSQMVTNLRLHAAAVGTSLAPDDLPAVLRDRMDGIAVRPPWGGHPRLSIYGLLEARMSRADLVVCGGLNEGSWPQIPAQDPLLAPAVLRALGVPGADFRIGLAAHDLAGMLGAPEVVLSRAERDADGPAIPSRFLLRVEALLGARLLETHRETRAVELARAIDASSEVRPTEQPKPAPSAEQRDVPIAITALDTLRSDPYQFYARAILGLRKLDALDEEPSAAWKGTIVHDILERWHKQGGSLADTAHQVLDEENLHPVMRALWLPRLVKGLEWVETELARLEGRDVIAVERKGEMVVDGVRIHGRADRIDRLSDGTLAIVDYKTGSPPSARRVKEGFSLQLGLVGMMAEMGGIEGVSGTAAQFEYWSLAKKAGAFGFRASPVKTDRNRAEIAPGEFTSLTDDFLHEAITRWIKGDEPFTARLVPNLEVYGDYDQLMRLEEWLGREDGDGDGA